MNSLDSVSGLNYFLSMNGQAHKNQNLILPVKNLKIINLIQPANPTPSSALVGGGNFC